ncbi:hypothetical protein CVS40_12949 [Lucilia cuprina]|nr:hypothetical protein CVS40_12949 [Lucilia cuprina]
MSIRSSWRSIKSSSTRPDRTSTCQPPCTGAIDDPVSWLRPKRFGVPAPGLRLALPQVEERLWFVVDVVGAVAAGVVVAAAEIVAVVFVVMIVDAVVVAVVVAAVAGLAVVACDRVSVRFC